jgi:hypothetical protein
LAVTQSTVAIRNALFIDRAAVLLNNDRHKPKLI